MAEQIVQLPADSTGKKMRTFETVVGANTVQHQAAVICDANGNIIGSMASAPVGTEQGLVTRPASLPNVTVAGGAASPAFVRTSDEPRQVFYDAFDGSVVDVTNRWTSTSGGGGVAAAQATGNLTLGTGTTTAGWASLGSQQPFTLPIPGWMGYSSVIKIESPITANTYRFWGAATIPGSPTVSAPITDGIGFELDIAGKLWAVVYTAGVRTPIQDLSASGNNKQPLDANMHRYIVYVRTDASYWYIDGIGPANLAATSGFQAPGVQALPTRMLAVAGTTPASSGVLTSSGTAVWDTAKNATQVSDGTFPWRKLTVSATGSLSDDPVDRAGRLLGRVTTPDTTSLANNVAMSATTNLASIAVSGQGVVGVQVTGTWTGTLIFEANTDGSTWFAINGVQSVSGAQVSTATVNGQWRVNAGGYQAVRVRCSVVGTGTAVVSLTASNASSMATFAEPLPFGSNEIGRVRITDGTNLGSVSAVGTRNGQDVNIVGSAGGIARVTNTFGAAPGAVPTPNTANVANTTVTVVASQAGNATFDVSAAAYVGTITFEASSDGGTTWFSIAAAREDGTGQDSTVALSGAVGRAWTTGVPGFTHLRVRATAWTSGTLTVGIGLGAFLVEPTTIATLSSNTPDVTDRAARLLGAVSISDGVAGPTAITTQNLNPNSGVATANSTVAVTNLNGVSSVAIQVTGGYTGQLTVQITTDGTNWVTLPSPLLSSPFGLYASANLAAGATGYYTGTINGITSLRVSANTAVTGTATVTIRASSGSGETQSVQGYTATGQAAIGNTVRVGGTDGGTVLRDIALDTSGHIQPAAPLNQSVDGTGAAQAFQFAIINTAVQGAATALIAAPAASRSIRVISYMVIVGGTALNVTLNGPSTAILLPLAANSGVSFAGTLQGPAFQLPAATAMTYTTSGAFQVTAHFTYVIV